MKVGILQTGRAPEKLRSTHGDYDEMSRVFLGLPHEFVRHYAVLDGHFPDDATDCEAWFITGSKYGVYEDHGWIAPLEAFIRLAYAMNRKMVGVCFGHQIMAQALGGKVEKFEKGFSVGAVDYTLTGPVRNAADGDTQNIRLHAYHQDQIIEPPKDAELTLTSDFCKYAGFAYKDWGLSVQPHPEFSSTYLKDLVASRRGTLLSNALADKATSSLKHPAQNGFQIKIQEFLGIHP